MTPYIDELVDSEQINDEQAKEKLLYLLLAWLYDNQEHYSDVLGMIEEIYSDFDYPEGMVTFIRYMPVKQDTLEAGEVDIYGEWKKYLGRQKLN